MKAITFPPNSRDEYALRLEIPAHLLEDFGQLRELFLAAESAKKNYSKDVPASGDTAMTAIHEYSTRMQLFEAWVCAELHEHLGYDYNLLLASSLWVVPEEHAEEMLYGYTKDTPTYNMQGLAKEMESIPYDGTLAALFQILSTLPPGWKHGKDFTVSSDSVHPLPVDWRV